MKDGVFGRARVVAETRRAETRQTRETHRDHEMGHDLAYEETKGLIRWIDAMILAMRGVAANATCGCDDEAFE